MTFWTALLLGTLTAADTPAVAIRFLDVGQGDATLIASPDGKRALVDAGRATWDVLEMLQGAGIDTLDLVVATHADMDHIGGLDGVLYELAIRYYMDNGVPHALATFDRRRHC